MKHYLLTDEGEGWRLHNGGAPMTAAQATAAIRTATILQTGRAITPRASASAAAHTACELGAGRWLWLNEKALLNACAAGVLPWALLEGVRPA